MIPAKCVDGLPSRFHQERVKLSGISYAEWIELMRQGKNQVIVMGIDKLLLSLLYPLFFLSVLASRAVTITTTIVPMMDFLARVTTIKMSPMRAYGIA